MHNIEWQKADRDSVVCGMESNMIDIKFNVPPYVDKAGSYGIQECDFVDHIEGDYTNVVGLPKHVVESMMKCVAL